MSYLKINIENMEAHNSAYEMRSPRTLDEAELCASLINSYAKQGYMLATTAQEILLLKGKFLALFHADAVVATAAITRMYGMQFAEFGAWAVDQSHQFPGRGLGLEILEGLIAHVSKGSHIPDGCTIFALGNSRSGFIFEKWGAVTMQESDFDVHMGEVFAPCQNCNCYPRPVLPRMCVDTAYVLMPPRI